MHTETIKTEETMTPVNRKVEDVRKSVTDSELAVLQNSLLFSGIKKDELLSLLPCLNYRKQLYKKGDWILRAGNQIDQAGVVLAGSAHVERYDYWGARHIISPLLPGDLFGESYAAVDHSVLNVSVQADEDASILRLDLSRMLHMCASACPFHARLIDNFVALLAQRNLHLNEKLTYITQHSLREKILSYLSAESIRQHSSYFDIPFDRQQLADYLNADRSALSNELSKLRSEGIIDYQKNHFYLRIPPKMDA